MTSIKYYFLLGLFKLIGVLPLRLLYLVSDVCYLLLFYVIQYRRRVILQNLAIAFPDQSVSFYHNTAKASTRHLCDLFIEMIKSMQMSKKAFEKRFVVENIEAINNYAEQQQSVVLLLGHYASYEWIFAVQLKAKFKGYAVYKPLRNKAFNRLIVKIRSKLGAILVPMVETVKTVISSQQKNEVAMYTFIADQSPKKNKINYFSSFFEKPTAAFTGYESLAQKFDIPVFYLQVQKLRRGYYSCKLVPVSEQLKSEEKYAVVDRFFQQLEAQIAADPRYYLWSHKRWKFSPEDIGDKAILSTAFQR
ncbi:MAG: lysophospholipid acyltransferase family protein [Flavobacteriaceae bacterium]|nr:lysophospholipid acyltransferase family protein [Flavobacteriaceae bacterium]